MSGRSRPVLKLVPAGSAGGPSHHGAADMAALRARIDADLARATGPLASRLRAGWDGVRPLCDPVDVDHLAEHAASLHEAADSVRRQHVETAEDLGPLWDRWAGPAAEAVQDRVSALARSAHALVVELETTAGRLTDAHDRLVDAVETLAASLAATRTAEPDAAEPVGVEAVDRAAEDCARAWDDARRVLAGGGGSASDVSRSGPRSP